jgi:hypothetical protein
VDPTGKYIANVALLVAGVAAAKATALAATWVGVQLSTHLANSIDSTSFGPDQSPYREANKAFAPILELNRVPLVLGTNLHWIGTFMDALSIATGYDVRSFHITNQGEFSMDPMSTQDQVSAGVLIGSFIKYSQLSKLSGDSTLGIIGSGFNFVGQAWDAVSAWQQTRDSIIGPSTLQNPSIPPLNPFNTPNNSMGVIK